MLPARRIGNSNVAEAVEGEIGPGHAITSSIPNLQCIVTFWLLETLYFGYLAASTGLPVLKTNKLPHVMLIWMAKVSWHSKVGLSRVVKKQIRKHKHKIEEGYIRGG